VCIGAYRRGAPAKGSAHGADTGDMMCTQQSHDAIRASESLWAREATYIGQMGDEIETLDLANCKHCGSTLARSRSMTASRAAQQPPTKTGANHE